MSRKKRRSLHDATVSYEANLALLGDAHPDTLDSMSALAGEYERVGDCDEAIALRERVAERRELLWGQDYATIRANHLLASSLALAKQFGRARSIQEDVFETWSARYGLDDEVTLAAMVNLANTLMELREYPRASELYERAVETSSLLSGEYHLQTLQLMRGLEMSKRALGKTDDADRIRREIKARNTQRIYESLQRRRRPRTTSDPE